MPWVLGRTTTVTNDPEMRGRTLADATVGAVITVDDFWGVGTSNGARWADGKIEVVAGWLSANGQGVFDDADALVLEPLHLADLSLPGGKPRIVVGDPTPATESAAWRPQRLSMQPRGSASVRVSAITNPAAATQIAIWYWRA